MKFHIIRTGGETEEHEAMQANVWDRIGKLIDASITDSVNLHDGRVMIVDDNGYDVVPVDHGDGITELRTTRARKPVNAEATKLYHAICRPGTTHQIVGDVAIINDADFE